MCEHQACERLRGERHGSSLHRLSGQKLKSYLPRILACTSLEVEDPYSLINFGRLKKDAVFIDEKDYLTRQKL